VSTSAIAVGSGGRLAATAGYRLWRLRRRRYPLRRHDV